MRSVYAITSKGQLTIPKAIREALGLRLGAPVLITVVSLESRQATLQLRPAARSAHPHL